MVAVIVTVLLSTFLVTLLWAGARSIIANSVNLDPQVQFRIDNDGSYTAYDDETGHLRIRVQRGADDDDPPVIALKFVLHIAGSSVVRTTYNVMSPNQATVYYMVVGFDVLLDTVSVAPIFLINGEEVEGPAFDLTSKIPVDPGSLKDLVGEVSIAHDPTIDVADGLQLYYSFSEGYATGTEIIDQSGAGHTGSLIGDVQVLAENGRRFATFDGAGDFIVVENGEGLADATNGDRTVSFWARFDCPAGISNSNQVPFGSHGNFLILVVDPCRELVNPEVRVDFDFPPADPRTFVSEDIWNDLDGWEFFAITFDAAAGEIRLYRNGALADMQTGLSLASSDPNPNFYVGTSSDIGGGPNGFSYLKGSLDELRIYNRTLSREEIQELHASVP